jgi:hypothetical protein
MRDRAVLDLARQEAFALVEAATPTTAPSAASGSASSPASGAPSSSASGVAKPNASAPVNELDRLLRRLPPEWQRRYHLARIG